MYASAGGVATDWLAFLPTLFDLSYTHKSPGSDHFSTGYSHRLVKTETWDVVRRGVFQSAPAQMEKQAAHPRHREAVRRRIIHVDMDAFYASVEQRDDPSLRHKPMVVGGSPNGRGVVSAASYEARKWGIHSAMPSSQALKRCPDLVFVKADFAKYREVSLQMREILADFTSILEPVSLDECYLDVTDLPPRYPTATEVARTIRRRIRDELHLTASAGVAPYKYVAKIASDYNKPDGLTVVHPDRVLAFLHPMPVSRLPGVGPAMHARLNLAGIYTIGDLAAWSIDEAAEQLGKTGNRLWSMAHGIDDKEVRTHRKRKSRSAERTYPQDIHSQTRMVDELLRLTHRVCNEIQKEKLLARTVRIKVRYPDFTTITRSSTLIQPTDAPEVVAHIAISLLKKIEPLPSVRLLGVGVANLIYPDAPRQLSLGL